MLVSKAIRALPVLREILASKVILALVYREILVRKATLGRVAERRAIPVSLAIPEQPVPKVIPEPESKVIQERLGPLARQV